MEFITGLFTVLVSAAGRNNARDQGTQDGILGEMLPLNKAEKWMRRAIDGLERTGERRDFLEIIGSEYH
jgi:hypothetical protein